jgi:hypothetical protein
MGFYVSGGGEGSIAAESVRPQPKSTESKDKIKRKLTLYHGGLQVEPAPDKTEGGLAKS